MASVTREAGVEKTRIMLGLLESVERDGAQSQRRLASELGIALGLVNAYLKRCVTKGLLKVSEAPARRYAYYLTPSGFAEKSQLTVEYLSVSFSLFREAKRDCAAMFDAARARGVSRIALLGVSDIAEIAAICALDCGITITAVVDSTSTLERLVGLPLVKSLDDLDSEIDAVLVTDVNVSREVVAVVVDRFGAERVLVPRLLGPRFAKFVGDAS